MGYLQSMLGQNLSEIQSLSHIQGEALAREYNLQIVEAELRVGKDSGNDYIAVRLEVQDVTAYDVYHTLGLPNGNMNEKAVAGTITRLREFQAAFGLDEDFEVYQDESGRRIPEWEGAVGPAILKYNDGDGKYPPKNEVAKFLTGPQGTTRTIQAAELEEV